MNRDKKVIFDDERMEGSLNAFVLQTGSLAINPYCNGEGQHYASRNELKQFLIDLLTKAIDNDMEYWIEEEAFSEEELNNAID